MPIALYPELTTSLSKVGGALSSWNRLTLIEEQILRRARSAFLTKWFGPGVPERRLSLYMHIANIEEFRTRYALVKRSMPGPLPEMNLLRPIAGMAGFATGLFFSPAGVVLFAPHIKSMFDMLTDSWWGDPASLIYSVVINWLMPILAPLLAGGLVAPALIIFAIAAALSGDRRSRAIHRLLGDSAMLIDAFLTFWEQITGPTDDIKNPVVKGIMKVLNRFSALFAQVLGFVAILITRFMPLIPNLIAQYRAALSLGLAVVDAIKDIISGFMQTLLAPFTGPNGILGILTSILDAFMSLPAVLIQHVRELISGTFIELRAAFDTLNQLLGSYIKGLGDRIISAFKQTPVGQMVDRIEELLSLVPQLTGAFRNIETAESEEEEDEDPTDLRGWWINAGAGGVFGPGLVEQVADIIDAVGQISLPDAPSLEIPEVPSVPTVPNSAALRTEIGLPGPIDFTEEANQMLARARQQQAGAVLSDALLERPNSAFAAERRRLRELGPTLDDVGLQLRDAIFLAVGRVLPPALRIYAPRVRALFQQLDERLYGVDSENTGPEMPQQELTDSGQLRPIVGMLTIRSAGGFAPDLRAFRDNVVQAMQRQTYLAPDAA